MPQNDPIGRALYNSYQNMCINLNQDWKAHHGKMDRKKDNATKRSNQ